MSNELVASTSSAVARSGDAARLSGLLFNDYARVADGTLDDFGGGYTGEYKPDCDMASTPVEAQRGKAYEALLDARAAVRAPVAFTQVIERAPEMNAIDADALDVDPDDIATSRDERDNDDRDLVDLLVRGTTMYAEWDHIDGVFEGLFETVPGRFVHYWAGSNPEEDRFGS